MGLISEWQSINESAPERYHSVLVARDAHGDGNIEFFVATPNGGDAEWIIHIQGYREEQMGTYVRITEQFHPMEAVPSSGASMLSGHADDIGPKKGQ